MCIISYICWYIYFIFALKESRNVFHTLESLYVHFSQPARNKNLMDIQNNLGIKKKTLTRLSDTRWNCRYKNCEAVQKCYASIITLLKEEIENNNDRDVNEAIGIN